MKRNHNWIKIQYFISFILLIGLISLGIFHASRGGINLTDEGLYFSAPYHYRFGVLPFKDAIHNATRQYDLLMAPIFILFPNITVLQYRIFGVLLHLSSLVAAFFLFSKFAPPLLVAVLSSIFFMINNFSGTPTPSYNLLVTVFGTWSFVLWNYALLIKGSGKKIILTILSGLFLFATVISNMSTVTLLFVPVAFVIFFYLNKKSSHELSPTIIMLSTTIFLFLLSGIILLISGLMPFFGEAIKNDAFSSNLSQGGVVAKILRSWEGVISVAPYSFYLTYLVFIIYPSFLWLAGLLNSKTKLILASLLLISILLFLIPVLSYPLFDLILVIFSVLSLPVILIYLSKTKRDEKIIFSLAIIWSLIQVISFAALSTNAMQASVKGVFFLFLVAVISIYRLLLIIPFNNHNDKLMKFFIFTTISALLIVFGIKGVKIYKNTNYLEVNYKRLVNSFKYPKLAGIYSIPEKIKPLEELLNYLKPRLKKGDYLLAYNDLPLLYYLTDTQPLYPNVWLFEAWWPLKYRKKLLEKMTNKGIKAPYAIHIVTNPGYGWGTPIAEGKSVDLKEPGECLICNYVENNYVIEKFVFPFEIWRLGKGKKYEFLKDFYSLYVENFNGFIGKDRELTHGNLVQITPFWLDAIHGRYDMQTRKEGDENIVKFKFNGVSSVYNSNLDIGYFSERQGFEFTPKSGEELVLTAKVRLSSRQNTHPYYSAILYIQDKLPNINTNTYISPEENSQGYPPIIEKDSLYWQTNSVAIQRADWYEYAVIRKIRDGATHISFGITWVPVNPGDWIEIKDIHLYTNDKNKEKIAVIKE